MKYYSDISRFGYKQLLGVTGEWVFFIQGRGDDLGYIDWLAGNRKLFVI